MSVEHALRHLGHALPPPPEPAANYMPWALSGNMVFLAGQTPKLGPVLQFKGKLGAEISIAQGKQAAELCALRLLSALQEAAGGLDRVAQIVKLTVFVNAAPDFRDHPAVADGASDLIHAAFGNRGAHARSAVGCAALPGDAAVEIDMIAELIDRSSRRSSNQMK